MYKRQIVSSTRSTNDFKVKGDSCFDIPSNVVFFKVLMENHKRQTIKVNISLRKKNTIVHTIPLVANKIQIAETTVAFLCNF